jgi:excisionase family DNA binding protein
MEEVYTLKQVADMFGVTRAAVYEWMRAGSLDYIVIGLRRRVTKSEIDRFIADGKHRYIETKEKKMTPDRR